MGLGAQPQLKVCPKCGEPISYIERRRIGGHVYIYAVHYYGYERGPDGKVRRKIRKCYLGPEAYTYVSRTLGVPFRGLAAGEAGALVEYVEAVARSLEGRARRGQLGPEEIGQLEEAARRLEDLARRLREYAASGAPSPGAAPNETVAKAQPVEAPPVTAAQTTEARPAEGEAYRMVSMLVGLAPEEVEREVRELLEATRELRRAQGAR